ncbi:MAG: aminotransferase class IV [Marinisporobacter sp.]|jgi:branched-chain amino acid aminotransferase|nr:aminotransferase class IV [Marinisporobacter sp.]
MKNEAFLDYYIDNGKECKTENQEAFLKISPPIVYEVIRVIDGVPLFLEEHLERMRKSATLLDVLIEKSDEAIKNEINRLIKINHCNNMNVKLLCSNLKEGKQDFLVYFIKSNYPEKEIYEKGIHTILYDCERKNPNAKVINTSFREHVNEQIKKYDAFEALLVNKEGIITEGSRSNMFFVKDQEVFTAPPKDVLLGVTRNRIMKVCKDLNIAVKEEAIRVGDIKNLTGAFMSGTSVNVLPVRSIDDRALDSVHNQIILKISKGYIQEMENYINARA